MGINIANNINILIFYEIKYSHFKKLKHRNVFYLIISIIIIIIIKTSSTGPSGKNKILYKIAYATPQAPEPRKTEKQTQWSNQRLTAP